MVMTDEQIRALMEAATPGPWQVNGSHFYGPDPERFLIGNVIGGGPFTPNLSLIAAAPDLAAECLRRGERIAQLEGDKDAAYLERNKLVALLASLFPSGIKRTAIEGWSDDWHGCVYIDFPWGQASWHYHDSQADLFAHLPPYSGEWDGHTTEDKYAAIVDASLSTMADSIIAQREAGK